MNNIIEISKLEKTYSNGNQALKGININIERGKFFGLLGPNGAGKTTTIGILTGLINLTSGDIKVNGLDIIRDYKKTRKMIGLSPQEINLDVFFTIKELLVFQGGYYGLSLEESKKRVDKILNDLGLEDKKKSKARELSGGMKRRVQIAKALIHDPEIILLDEPTMNLDMKYRKLIWDYINEYRKEKTIIFSTQNLEEAKNYSNRIAVVYNAVIKFIGKYEDLSDVSYPDFSLEKYLLNLDRNIQID